MINKSQSISARLCAEDYEYLMSIDRNGAVTQSEKVRELIAIVREAAGIQTFTRCYISAAETMLPIKAQYVDEGRRSLIVEALLELLTDGAAAIQACSRETPMTEMLEQRAMTGIEVFLEKILSIAGQGGSRAACPGSIKKLKQQLERARVIIDK